jgi:hypothetical protein
MAGGAALLAHAIGEDEAAIKIDGYFAGGRIDAPGPPSVSFSRCHVIPSKGYLLLAAL